MKKTKQIVSDWQAFTHGYNGEIWKRVFISTVRPTIYTNPSRKRSFSKALFKMEEFKNADFLFSCDGELF